MSKKGVKTSYVEMINDMQREQSKLMENLNKNFMKEFNVAQKRLTEEFKKNMKQLTDMVK
jgi:hypothetical protein